MTVPYSLYKICLSTCHIQCKYHNYTCSPGSLYYLFIFSITPFLCLMHVNKGLSFIFFSFKNVIKLHLSILIDNKIVCTHYYHCSKQKKKINKYTYPSKDTQWLLNFLSIEVKTSSLINFLLDNESEKGKHFPECYFFYDITK